MSSTIFSRLGIAALAIGGLWAAGPRGARPARHPAQECSGSVLPERGEHRPEIREARRERCHADGSGGRARACSSSAVAMRNLMSQSKNRARVQKELAPVFQSQTRVLLTPGSGQVVLTAEAISSCACLSASSLTATTTRACRSGSTARNRS